MKRLLVLILLLTSQMVFAQDKERDIEKFFLGYVDQLKAADYHSALNAWALLDRTISEQLHVYYTDEPVKMEMDSPLWENIEKLRDGSATLSVDTVRFSRDFARINYTIKTGRLSIPGRSYAISESVLNPRFVSALHVYCESWEETSSRFLRLKYRDPSLFQPSSLDEADRFIEETGRKIGLSAEQMIILETIKFNAFLCESYGEVEQVTGKLALGSLLPSMDAVISRYMPPYHELVQFLVNYSLKNPPAYTHAFFKYGTATFMGGRWGRSSEVQLAMGSYLYLNDLAELDTLMSSQAFGSFEANPDFAYPLAGLFCEYLWNELGRVKYFELYRQFSGTRSQVNAITAGQFKEMVSTALGKDWATVEADFKKHVGTENLAGITPGGIDKGNLVFESGTTSFLVRVLEDSTHYQFIIDLKKTDAEGALVLSNMGTIPYKSFLYGEQFADTVYANQVYGIRFSAVEAGTYDYYQNLITGKYIVGLNSPEPLTDKSGKSLRFRVEKRLLGGFDKLLSRVVDTR